MITINASPRASSHLKTLQRIGHTLNTAISDIIDNSITAKATIIKIYFDFTESTIKIEDNGIGMLQNELHENMIIGCKDPFQKRDKSDLGRFGSGMKMASFSQAHKLVVLSKKNNEVNGILYDVDEIYKTDKWQMHQLEKKEIDDHNFDHDIESGTTVIWKNLIKFQKISQSEIEDEFGSDADSLIKHIALHFHKFISGPKSIKILVNNIAIDPIDPFFKNNKGYQEGPTEQHYTSGGKIVVKTHIIPHHDYMTKSEIENYGGLDKIEDGQGIYVYRERRLILYGGWMGLKPRHTIARLARIEVEVPSSLDHEWSTDVKKSEMQFPSKAKRLIKHLISQPIERSKKEYVYRGKKEENNKFWFLRNNERTSDLTYLADPKNSQLKNILQGVSNDKRREILEYLQELSKSLPLNSIHEKMSSNAKQIKQDDEDNLDFILENLRQSRKIQ